jgi:hypothetical protein
MQVADMMASCNHSGRCSVRNCGSTATMKMMPLGLVALVRKPASTRWRQVSRRAWAWPMSRPLPTLRHWLQPR